MNHIMSGISLCMDWKFWDMPQLFLAKLKLKTKRDKKKSHLTSPQIMKNHK